jgi:hypothetical protein
MTRYRVFTIWCTIYISCLGFVSSQICNPGYTSSNFIGRYSLTAFENFDALVPQNTTFTSVANKMNPGVGTLPTYDPNGGPNGKGHVSFNRNNSQFVSSTRTSLSDDGFTFVAVMRFTGTPVADERIFELGYGPGFFRLSRNGLSGTFFVSTSFSCGGYNGNQDFGYGSVPQNTWVTLRYTYFHAEKKFYAVVNNQYGTVNFASWFCWPATTSMQGMHIGTSRAKTNFMSADVAGAFFLDAPLGHSATQAIADQMANGVDLTDTKCPTECIACPVGTFKSTNDGMPCTPCSFGTTQSTASNSSVHCVCPRGYEN